MGRNSAEPSKGGACCSGLVLIAGMTFCMTWISNNVGFDGFVQVVVSLVVSFVAAGLVSYPVWLIAAWISPAPPVYSPGRSGSPVSRPPSSSGTEAKPEPAEQAELRISVMAHLRTHDPQLADELDAFEKLAAERPEFTEEQRRAVLSKVGSYWDHHQAYRHILDDPQHPDQATVEKDMRRYRSAVAEMLRLRNQELQSGSYGGFEYRKDLRTAEGSVDLLRDEFDEYFRELEKDWPG